MLVCVQHHLQRLHPSSFAGEEIRTVNQAVFGHFCIACPEFTLTQCIKHFRIGQHKLWLIKHADKVLAKLRVDAGLAANGRIHLCKQRGWHLNEIHAATYDTGNKAGQITHNTAAKSHNRIATFKTSSQHSIGHSFQCREGL